MVEALMGRGDIEACRVVVGAKMRPHAAALRCLEQVWQGHSSRCVEDRSRAFDHQLDPDRALFQMKLLFEQFEKVHKDVPIIIITTEGSTEDRQRAIALGANAYITKPIQAPQVIAKVRELLGIEGPPSSSMPAAT